MASDRTDGPAASCGESILIIDDYRLYRESLAGLVALNGRYHPIVAWDLPSLVVALEDSEPVVAVLNLATRGSSLLLRAMKDIHPHIRAVALGAREDDESQIVDCAEAGVSAYHMRGDSFEDLLGLIDNVAAGKSDWPPRITAILLRRVSTLAAHPQPAMVELALTAREAQILRLLELGQSNRDIASQLSIALYTVKNHVHSLLTKLGVHTRTEAAELARGIRTNRHQGGD
ncbi:response regulator transcription factor [Mycobacterium sp. URHB0044]|uniref:LuxR C-terminal-related transcriptional regulator n=1 Tax=Mycobacterium sp. URHB0044 TaxID=1380386 RepID=UPI000B20E718|nr:response regulator transcription factor [Mycobacterium sp. URHB0044]